MRINDIGIPRSARLRSFLLIPLIAVVLAGCGGDSETANDQEGAPAVSPDAADMAPVDTQVATLEITDGNLDATILRLTVESPTQVNFVNNDSVTYSVEIEDLVQSIEIPASETTEIGFTTPAQGTFDGQLLGEDGDTVAEFTVEVTEAGDV